VSEEALKRGMENVEGGCERRREGLREGVNTMNDIKCRKKIPRLT
jgi:hypothetical protein